LPLRGGCVLHLLHLLRLLKLLKIKFN
jgi:hypothetical protein